MNYSTYDAMTTAKAPTLAEMQRMLDDVHKQISAQRPAEWLTPNPALPLTGRALEASLPIIPDKDRTITRKPPTRRRRRLWRHWLATRTIPDPNIYVVGGVILGHPETIERMAEAAHRLNNQIPAPDQMEFQTTP